MDLKKLNPWNWFKHEEGNFQGNNQIPVKRSEAKEPSVQKPYEQHPVVQLHHQIDKLFNDVFSSFNMPLMSGNPQKSSMYDLNNSFRKPCLDISGSNENYEMKLDVPGLTESDLDLEINENVLVIKGRKVEENETKDKQYYRIERSVGEFKRILSLPVDANTEGIKAQLKNGVLKLTIPRLEIEQNKVKKIPIK